jgi:hypothetical protein
MSVPSQCGYEGHPGKGGDGAPIRLYSQSECEKKNGIFHANGECTYPTGGSLSWDCREVNNDPIATLYQYRWYIGGAAVAGGLVYWRMNAMRR